MTINAEHLLIGEDPFEHGGGAQLPPRPDEGTAQRLPAGAHPGDASTAGEGTPGIPRDEEKDQQHRPGREPWGTDNEEALPVYNRAAHDWTPGQVFCNTGTGNTGVSIIVGRQAGRARLTIWVPLFMPSGAAPLGVLVAPTREALFQGGLDCVVLNPGDSMTIDSEGPAYAGVIAGNATGFCQFLSLTNPLARGRELSF